MSEGARLQSTCACALCAVLSFVGSADAQPAISSADNGSSRRALFVFSIWGPPQRRAMQVVRALEAPFVARGAKTLHPYADDDRSLHVDHAERPKGLNHARGDRAPVSRDRGE